jgi:antitoxin VapB
MKMAKIFQNGQSQAIRLPKEFRFDGTEVFINKVGKVTILFPVEDPWGAMIDSVHKFSDDFMNTRNQPDQQEREDLF